MIFIPANQPALPPSTQAWCFAFVQRDLLLPEADAPSLQPLDSAWLAALATTRHYLGTLAGQDCWALALPEPPPGWRRLPLRAAMLALDATLAALAGRASQVLEWDRSHRHCGVCGTPTELQPGERARICPACQHSAYPRLSPAMMALVWRPGELLLARSPHYAAGMYSALAGFVEAGESLEDCVHREVAEEVAVRVTELRYYGSQSWPFPHSLMIAFTARWAGGEIVAQAGEIEHAQWFALDALPNIPPRLSIAGHLIRDTLASMRSAAAVNSPASP
ncbi:MAG: NAD(+) diphosphatase [Burkholderiaceae bacterium]|nr:NAD(+) diphosphatase [Burkholderiaceae bacterium]